MPRELGRQGLRASEMNHLLAVLAAACCLCESRSWEGRPPRPSSVVISALQQPGQPQWTPGSSGAERLAQPRVGEDCFPSLLSSGRAECQRRKPGCRSQAASWSRWRYCLVLCDDLCREAPNKNRVTSAPSLPRW